MTTAGASSEIHISSLTIDPTVLNTRKRLTVFLDRMIHKKYTIFLPSLISTFIKKEQWEDLTKILRQWEWNLDRAQSEEWFKSSDFKNYCRQLGEVCLTLEGIREKLSPEEREQLSKIFSIIRYESPRIVEIAKELVAVSIIKRGGIVSYTRHLKRWLKNLRRVLIIEISEKTNAVSVAKAEIRERFSQAGWKGRLFVTFLSVTTALALSGVLPPLINKALDVILAELAEEAIICVITNG